MQVVWLGLGSNLDRKKHLQAAVRRLKERFGTLFVSSVYETAAVGFEGPPFYNLVVGFETDLAFEPLVLFCKEIEQQVGRCATATSFSSKEIDIDLLLFGDITGEFPMSWQNQQGESVTKIICLPRPEIFEQAYVLAPLAELLPHQHAPNSAHSYLFYWQIYQTKYPNTLLNIIGAPEFFEFI